MTQHLRHLFLVAVWCLCFSPSGASCANSNLDQCEDDASSLLQIGGSSRGISPRSKPAAARVGCPQCKGCIEERACNAGQTPQEYCATRSEHACAKWRDPATAHCCSAFTVECEACQNQRTYHEQCIAEAQRCHTWASECENILVVHCTAGLAKGEDFSGDFCACQSIVMRPYDGPPRTVKLNKRTCSRHEGKELFWTPFRHTPEPIHESLERCIQLGDNCFGVTCVEEGDSVDCTVKRSTQLYAVADDAEPPASSVFSLLKSECTKKKKKKMGMMNRWMRQ